MYQAQLKNTIEAITEIDCRAAERCRNRVDSFVKPPKSLGALEELAIQLASITHKTKNTFPSRQIVVFCADNGVAEEGVSSAPVSVTASQAENFTKGITGVCVFARYAKAQLSIIDVGIQGKISNPDILSFKIRNGTDNFLHGPAMQYDEAQNAIVVGIEAANRAAKEGITLLGTGEMGIGNTTTASAVLSALTGIDPQKTSGRGAGLSEAAFHHKIDVIRMGIAKNNPNGHDPVDVLSKVGGLDIAGMTGLFLGGAANRIPVVIDGFISIVAALCAVRLCPKVSGYLIPSHLSKEPGYQIAAKELSLSPYLLLNMGLGEGSGCPFAFSLIDYACCMMNEMGTFSEGKIDQGYLEEIQGALL